MFPVSAYAGFTFSLSKSTFTSDETISINTQLNIQNGSGKTYYLEGALRSTSLSNYFGLTWNDTNWVQYTASSNYNNLKSITLDSNSSWSGNIDFKLDTSSNYWIGTGDYVLKLKRFTSSSSSSDSDNTANITITNSLPSPSPSPSANNAASPTPSPSTSIDNFIIAGIPSTLEVNQAFILNTTLNNLNPSSTYYLKGAFKKTDSSNYFGQTQVNNEWIKNSSSYSNQYKITPSSTSSTQQISIMPDASDSGYTGSGTYIFKLGRYDNTGNLIWSNEYTIQLSGDPSTSPSPSPTPTQIPNSPSPRVTPAVTVSPIIFTPSITPDVQIASIAGISKEQSPEPSNTPLQTKIENPFFNPIIWYILGSSAFIVSAVMFAHRAYKIRQL